MENLFVTKEELDSFMLELEGIKSSIEILQNKEMMNEIKESEENRKRKIEISEIESVKNFVETSKNI